MPKWQPFYHSISCDPDYNNAHLVWNNQWESRRVTLTFTCKLGSGHTHSGRTSGSGSGSADEEGRAGR